MSVIMSIEISDDLARRFEMVVDRVGASREDCLREIVELGLEDMEDAIEADDAYQAIEAGDTQTVRMSEKEERLVAMGG